MNRAYLFPFEVKIDRTQAHRATPVNLDTEHKTLVQAARHHRLRCTYGACLEPVTLVHQEAGSKQLRCFAHLPATEDSPFCPYRTYPDEVPPVKGDPTGIGHRYTSEHNLRKVIENDLHVELQRIFADRGLLDVRIESSAYWEKEPRIRINGLEPPLQIRGLAPGCEELWSEPFAGSVDGEEVLFFVVSPDAPSLQQSFIDTHLLARRPAILVYPAAASDGEHTYAIVSHLADPVTAMPFAKLDLMRVDYCQLFGLDRAAEYLFIPSSYRQVIEEIGARLAVAGLAPEEAKALRLYAKRLLVDGAAVHSTVFGQSREEARRFLLGTDTFPPREGLLKPSELGLLLQNRELQDFCAGKPLLAPLGEVLFRQAFTVLGGTIASLRKQVAELRKELTAAAAKQTAQARQLADSETQRQSLKDQIADKERAWSERETELKKELDTALEDAAELRRQAEVAAKELVAAVAQRKDLAGRLADSEHSLEEVKSHPIVYWMRHLGHQGSGQGRAT